MGAWSSLGGLFQLMVLPKASAPRAFLAPGSAIAARSGPWVRSAEGSLPSHSPGHLSSALGHAPTRLHTYNQPIRPNRQTSQTKHQALPKGRPGRRITPINTAVVDASAQQQPAISRPTPDRVITRSFQPTQPAAKLRSNTGGLAEQAGGLRRRAQPHNTIDTTRLRVHSV